MQSDLTVALATALDDMVWNLPEDTLVSSQSAVRILVEAAGCALAALFRELSDETLILAVQKKFFPTEAFEEGVVNRYEKSLSGWFFKKNRNGELARDLTQDLYVKLLTGALDHFDAEHPFRNWFWRVVHNFWVQEYRRSLRPQALPLEWEFLDDGLPPDEEASYRELSRQVEVLVRALPAPQGVILCQTMAGACAGDIALSLQLPKARVQQLLFRARRAVERSLTVPPRPVSGTASR